ncbi:MAG: NAD(P)H-hydrate dehydratase [Dehalococcoidia bacterium]|nr:NAD(P)H-hydrate dehydratase [Dehalococcoidia bacterium]
MKIVTVAQMRALEAAAGERGISTGQLMENAGLAVAQEIRAMLPAKFGGGIIVLAGPGNNGGDALVAASHLQDWGIPTHVFLLAPRPEPDPVLDRARECAVRIVSLDDLRGPSLLSSALRSADIALDAALGTGASRPIAGPMRDALLALAQERARRPSLRIVALDIPSGLHAGTGARDDATPSADVTLCLGFPKQGLFRFPGAAKVGRLVMVDIGMPDGSGTDISLEMMTSRWARALLPPRPLDANKGTFGKVMIVAGSAEYVGAATLACGGAIRAGAGLVTLAAPRSLIPAVAARLPEVTYLPLDERAWGVPAADAASRIAERLSGYDALLIGCGLGQGAAAAELMEALALNPLPSPAPALVLDADALNILAKTPQWWQRVAPNIIVTPHPGEMSRLTGVDTRAIQAGRIAAARQAAAAWRAVVLLKGAFTVVAAPDGAAMLCPHANPALATAGTGDVLAGVIASLLAQGLAPYAAAALGVFLHAHAGERVRQEIGDAGVAASDLLAHLPGALNSLRAL